MNPLNSVQKQNTNKQPNEVSKEHNIAHQCNALHRKIAWKFWFINSEINEFIYLKLLLVECVIRQNNRCVARHTFTTSPSSFFLSPCFFFLNRQRLYRFYFVWIHIVHFHFHCATNSIYRLVLSFYSGSLSLFQMHIRSYNFVLFQSDSVSFQFYCFILGFFLFIYTFCHFNNNKIFNVRQWPTEVCLLYEPWVWP